MRRGTAIGVDDNFATGQTTVTMRTANHKPSSRVDQITDLAFDQVTWQNRLNHFFDHGFAQGLERDIGRMLGRQHNGINRNRPPIDVAQSDLALGIRTQPGQTAVAAQIGLTLDQPMREVDRRRHEFGCLIAGVAKHQALIASTLIEIVVMRPIHTTRDIGTLLVVCNQHRTAAIVDAVLGIVITNAANRIPSHVDVIDLGVRRDFTRQNHQASITQGLGGDARIGVLGQNRI